MVVGGDVESIMKVLPAQPRDVNFNSVSLGQSVESFLSGRVKQ